MKPIGPVVARTRSVASRERVWQFITTADLRAQWWPDLYLVPEVGGDVTERWSERDGDTTVSRDAVGTVDVCSPGNALGFRWRERTDDSETAVLITLRTFDDETSIMVTETGFDRLPEAAARAASSLEGWNILLRDLVAVMGTEPEPANAESEPTDLED